MEQKILKVLLIQLKVFAVVCVAAMLIILSVAFGPAKSGDDKSYGKCEKEKQEQVRETLLIGNLFSFGALESE